MLSPSPSPQDGATEAVLAEPMLVSGTAVDGESVSHPEPNHLVLFVISNGGHGVVDIPFAKIVPCVLTSSYIQFIVE